MFSPMGGRVRLRSPFIIGNGEYPFVIQTGKTISTLVNMCAYVVAQNLSNYSLDIWKTYPLDESVKTALQKFIKSERLQIKYLSNLKAWYPNGNLCLHQEFDEKGMHHGLSTEYHDNGSLWLKDEYKKGELHGISEWYSEDGTLFTKQQFRNGRRHGYCVWYYDNGSIQRECIYSRGKLHGITKEYNESRDSVSIAQYDHGLLLGCKSIQL